MDDNLPKSDDQKLKSLESDLGAIENEAKQEIKQDPQQPVSQTPPAQTSPEPQAPETPQATQQPNQMPNVHPNQVMGESSSKSKMLVWIAIVVLLLAILGAGAYYFFNMNGGYKTPSPTPTPTLTPTPNPTLNWNLYEDIVYSYSVKYPQDWTVEPTPTKGTGGIATLTGTNSAGQSLKVELGKYTSSLKDSETLKDYLARVGVESTSVVSEGYETLSNNLYVYKQTTDLTAGDKTWSQGVIYTFSNNNDVYFAEGFTNNAQTDTPLFDMIMSTFGFKVATPSSSPVATSSATPSATPI